MPDKATVTYNDFNGESSRTEFNIPVLTGANLDDTINDIGVNDTTGATLLEGMSSICAGVFAGVSFNIKRAGSKANAADENAQRERKWLMVYEDVTAALPGGDANPGFGKEFTQELPVALANGDTLLPDSDQANFGFAGWQDFIDRFEAECLSPYGGTPNVLRATLVGRNL